MSRADCCAQTVRIPQRIGALNRKRVVLVALPALMEDLVRRACLADDSIEVVASTRSFDQMQLQLTNLAVDVMIAAVHGGDETTRSLAILAERPTMRVLLIAATGASADLYELRPHRTRLGPVSPAEIVRALHDDTEHAQAWASVGMIASGGSSDRGRND
jgi:DNA-binding NarL/FixJ family response regulator